MTAEEKLLKKCISRLRDQIEEEKTALHRRIQQIEYDCKQRIQDQQRDFVHRVEPMRRELDQMLKAASLKHAYSTVPPIITPTKDSQ